ncbi:MAG: hypothetical protein AB8H79_17280, partial [Myxococcota bacterium]
MSDEVRSLQRPNRAHPPASTPGLQPAVSRGPGVQHSNLVPRNLPNSVVGQARWGLVSATGSLLVAYVLTLSLMWAEVFGFGGAFSLRALPVLPVAAALLLWAGLAGAGILSAVRISRLARWSKIDPEYAPISPLKARVLSGTL